jgi:thioesterase domain-containing protein/acyl carrier protein
MKNVADIFPLTPMQELMLVHALAARESSVLVNQLVYAISGPLDAAALEAAWQAVVERHAMLRTGFAWENLKRPMQFVRETVTLPFEILDWRGEPESARQELLERFLSTDRERELDLTRPPLMRLTLIRIAAAEHWLAWTSHHLILDRWCIGLILGEVNALYTERAGGRPAILPPARSFRDYVAWLQKQDAARTESFWREQLRGLRGPTPLPLLPAGRQAPVYAEARQTLSAELADSLRRFAQRRRLTMGSVALGAWALLLGALSGQAEVLLGITVSGRPVELSGVEGIVGSFINTVPLRLALPADAPLGAWLAEVQNRQLALRDFEFVAPAQLQDWSDFGRNVPLFDTLFLFQAPVKVAEGDGLRWRSLYGTLQTGLPLALAVSDSAEGFEVWATYDRTRLGAATISDWLANLENILRALAAEPGGSLADYFPAVKPVAVAQPAAPSSRLSSNGHAPAAHRVSAPRNSIEARLAQLWGAVLDLPEVDITTSFFEAGGTSLKALQLMERVERTFRNRLPLASLLHAPTIEKLARLIDSGGAAQQWSSLIAIQPLGQRRPLFTVHHGGGGIFEFANVARYLGNDQPVYGFQEPGFEAGEARLESVEALAAHYLQELRTVQPEGPYALAGFCFGGVVAYEMAQQLRREGQLTDALFLIDALSPSHVLKEAPVAARVQRHADRMARLSFAERVSYLLRRVVKRLRWEVQRRMIELKHWYRLSAFRAYQKLGRPEPPFLRQYALLQYNAELLTRYHAQPYEAGAVLIRGYQEDLPEDYGWDALINGGVEIRPMPTADHLQMMIEPNVSQLAEYLQKSLAPATITASAEPARPPEKEVAA